MAKINEHFLELKNNYLFSTIMEKTNEYKMKNPNQKIISLGIGDVTLPLTKEVIKAMHKSVDELSDKKTFKGYGTVQGYDFLIEKIIECEYRKRNVDISPNEVFISAGTKGDLAGILDLFSADNKVRNHRSSISCIY